MNPRNAIELTADANELLRAVEAMSQANRADTPADRRGRHNSPPWLVALASILRSYGYGPFDADASDRWRLPVYDGDRPAGLTDADVDDACRVEPMCRGHNRALDARALTRREFFIERVPGAVRRTHREVHETLAGEPCPTCQWCRKDGA